MANYKINSYDMSNVKMIGRVDTVRVRSSIDTNGNRSTEYVVAGRDWGQIFESYVNIDPAYIGESSGLAAISKISFLSKFENLFKTGGLASTTDLMVFSLSLMKLESASSVESLSKKGISLGSLINSSTLKLPGPFSGILGADAGSSLLSFLPQLPTIGGADTDVFSSLSIKTGKINPFSKKYEDVKESFGTLNTGAVIGINSIWSIVNAHANTIVNEVFCDLSSDANNKPLMTLYKRLKPFHQPDATDFLGNLNPAAGVSIKSDFTSLPSIKIPGENIISVDVGTNGRDIINFIELVSGLSTQNLPQSKVIIDSNIKLNGTTWSTDDQKSLERDGLRPLKLVVYFFPQKNGNINYSAISEWLPVLRGWFFDSHKMFNGSVALVGLDQYIPVGDNIEIDANLIFGGAKANKSNEKTVLAHVESVSHSFSINYDGAKTFTSSVSFSRGIIKPKALIGLLPEKATGIDHEATSAEDYKNNATYFTKG
jgi:hypothetical protein